MSPDGAGNVQIGPLAPEDRGQWERLFRGYIEFYERTLPDARYDQAWEEFQSAARMHALGARAGGELIGIAHFFIHANTSGPDVCYLQDLFTAPREPRPGRGHGAHRGDRRVGARAGLHAPVLDDARVKRDRAPRL